MTYHASKIRIERVGMLWRAHVVTEDDGLMWDDRSLDYITAPFPGLPLNHGPVYAYTRRGVIRKARRFIRDMGRKPEIENVRTVEEQAA